MEFSPELTRRAARIEREILDLNRHAASGQLESVARLLMRSEAISSSRIEGIAPNADKVVLAELAQVEEVRGFKEGAEEVARNLTVLRSIEKSFATEPTISVELLEKLRREWMGEKGSISTGLRTIQNWTGGSNHTPIGAEFIPAPPGLVHDLVDDLCLYLDGASHGALIQAAIAHAQFETIHPFADGNGHVGPALIHGILLRRGLTKYTILPVSLLLLGTRSKSKATCLFAPSSVVESSPWSARISGSMSRLPSSGTRPQFIF
ncbi:Fic family protein [Corynebacterium striatum]|uniref:Fic family protein n=1 Tax=Corynebacterium striatum TaxID=43770 RepID=UPI00254D4C83|nr:Fic family protein [Corynebacterium striatum]MDK7884739.1 Fic family protein [Corynebacterium striatum]